jgi:biopolymer transport protein ExbD
MKDVTSRGASSAIARIGKERKTGLELTPMIDCVFLLLIFFMVATVMKAPPPFSVILPDSLKREDFPRKRYNVFISEEGRVSVDDMTMPDLDSLELFLASHQDKIKTLIIKADRNAKHGIVIDVMERAKRRFRDPEGQSIAIAVREGEYQGAF